MFINSQGLLRVKNNTAHRLASYSLFPANFSSNIGLNKGTAKNEKTNFEQSNKYSILPVPKIRFYNYYFN